VIKRGGCLAYPLRRRAPVLVVTCDSAIRTLRSLPSKTRIAASSRSNTRINISLLSFRLPGASDYRSMTCGKRCNRVRARSKKSERRCKREKGRKPAGLMLMPHSPMKAARRSRIRSKDRYYGYQRGTNHRARNARDSAEVVRFVSPSVMAWRWSPVQQ